MTMIALTTAQNAGAFDAGQSYTHVLLDQVHLQADRMTLELRHGYMDESTFVRGKLPAVTVQVTNEGEGAMHWDDFNAMLSQTDEPAGTAFKRCCCEHAIARVTELAGTVS